MGGESVASTEINRKATESVNKADFNKKNTEPLVNNQKTQCTKG